jgi:hypothetical protein
MYLHRIDHLFTKRHCLSLVGTYTEYAIQELHRPRAITLHTKNTMRSFGGNRLQPEMIDRCLSRMTAWVRLVLQSISAEFPSWEILNAFGAFNLKLTNQSSFVRDSLQRISAVFQLDSHQLLVQFDDFKTFAMTRSSKGSDNLSSWTSSILAIQNSLNTRARHPCEQLSAAVCRYALCMGATTSGVERNFSAILPVIGKDRQSLQSSKLANDIRLRLVQDCGASPDQIVRSAMLIWAATYGIVRMSGNQRKQRWAPGKRVVIGDGQRLAESHWIAKRREAVTRLVQSGKKRTFAEMSIAAKHLSSHAWSPGHDKAVKCKHSRGTTM